MTIPYIYRRKLQSAGSRQPSERPGEIQSREGCTSREKIITVRLHDDRLPNIVMRGEMVGGKRKRGQPAKRLEHRVTEYCTAFGIDPKCWMRAAQDAPEWYRKVETGAEVFMSAWSTKRVNETNARHAKELFATLPFELP